MNGYIALITTAILIGILGIASIEAGYSNPFPERRTTTTIHP